jgi:hypothetical protein
MPKALDPMWVYGGPVQLPNRQVLTCNLCGKKIFAGISRLKYHLAKIPGFDVDPCPKSTPEIVRPAITRFATTFISLQSLLKSMLDLLPS